MSETAAAFDAQRFVASLPLRPGVYRMYDASGELIYVGKAARLRDRVGSYFSSRPQSPKVAAMLKRVNRVEVTVVGSETDALLLECNLIKAHRPRYNVILRDDKSFPYLLCPTDHDFPRLQFWRGLRRPAGRLFGPFPNALVVKQVLQQLQKVFRIRNCRDGFFAHRTRPCLQHQIGRCSGPCVGLITKDEYRQDLDGALRVLEGGSAALRAELEARMGEAAAALQFETAARLRDQLAGLTELQSQQIANAPRTRDVDVIALQGEPGQYAIALLTVREGRSLGTTNVFPTAVGEPADTLAEFLLQHYARAAVPAEIIIDVDLPDHGAVSEALLAVAGHAVRLSRGKRGLPGRWLELAEENAREALRMRANRRDTIALSLQWLADHLGLPAAPERIECFDISHTGGEGTVAGCVVFGPDGPLKRAYRRYNIEGVEPGDDYAALEQALARHGARIVAGDLPRPDLLVIDGGPGQLRAAEQGLARAQCSGLALLGISKGADRRPGQERLHLPGEAAARTVPPDSPVLHLLQRIRDEAHRFAITGHRRRRARRFQESILETVPGLGPARRRALLVHFGGLPGVLRAGVADLERVEGVGTALARTLYDHLHPGA
ncbi:MAG TPA: excinuclease ABC subunit UvrC [Steroidobacteraceae bacterium]|nr:excinuclease ABC subunit UvrC [Steroidobacteraceae bacterium]